MHVFILSIGTRGDFELFLTLGRELRGRGHDVVLGTSVFYAERTREAGLEWVQMGKGTFEELTSILSSLSSVRDKKERTYSFYRRWLRPQLDMSKELISSLGSRTDYFVNNLKIVLQRGGRVVRGAAVTYDPPNRIEDLARFGTQQYGGSILDLVALPRRLVDPQHRWADQVHFTGFWRNGSHPGWEPPASLVEFLAAGTAPVVVTMGSMGIVQPGTFVRTISEAARLAGTRAVIVAGWSGIARTDATSPDVHCVADVPYGWLFPQASCVIHHGGVGTLASVLEAGRPSILLPQVTCQEHIAKMLLREGLATGTFEADALDPEDLAAAIRLARTDPHVAERARAWQGLVAQEPGVRLAADLIEAHAGHASPSTSE